MPKLDYHFLYTLYQASSRSYGKYYTITLWFPCLDGLIQTRGNVARVQKSTRTRVEGE